MYDLTLRKAKHELRYTYLDESFYSRNIDVHNVDMQYKFWKLICNLCFQYIALFIFYNGLCV